MAHSEELRNKIFELKNSGLSLNEISKETEIPKSSVQTIIASKKTGLNEKTYNIKFTWEEAIEIKKFIEEYFENEIIDFKEITGEYLIGAIDSIKRDYMLARQEIKALDADIEKIKKH